MAKYDFTATRLFVDAPLSGGAELALAPEQANYVCNVMRLREGDGVLVFNGRDGEWRADLTEAGRKRARLTAVEQIRPQTPPGDLWYLFAPLKHARLDYMVQKAVEMGASRLMPVITRRTQASRVNTERMTANVIEAAEQCGVLSVAEVAEPQPLAKLLDAWPRDRALVFCDEDAEEGDAVAALAPLRGRPLALVIGPEGGFDEDERRRMSRMDGVIRLSLGPRILRADTAAVAALTLLQAVCGDWASQKTSP